MATRNEQIKAMENRLNSLYAARKNGRKEEKEWARKEYADYTAYVMSIGLVVARNILGRHTLTPRETNQMDA